MKRRGKLWALCAAMLGLACSCEQANREYLPIPKAECRRAVDAVFEIDGKLDERSWALAEKLPFHLSSSPPEALAGYSGKLVAQWCWDDAFWYVAFTFDSPDINCPAGKKDWRSYNDDQVEMLIDPNGDGRHYCGMEIMPLKYVLDYVVKRSPKGHPIELDAAWDFAGMQVGIAVDGTVDNRKDTDRRWVCEIAIPWSAFATVPGGARPRHGTQWRVNLLANDFLPPRGKEYIELMWSACYDLEHPSYKFHMPGRFGKVKFLEWPLGGEAGAAP